jgi:asparagine synthase (glutamine-hydrolysing)
MCGITGLINHHNSKSIIDRMLSSMNHRGPDASGVWQSDNITLGHVRLTIIDLSERANQPFIKDNFVLVYNGEVYNFIELRKELEAGGVKFNTTSDTEVVLELFRKFREKSFEKLRGMFAFAIYDIKTKETYLVRDYFGIKPLYYSRKNNKLAFASELKAFNEVPEFSKKLNMKSVISSMNYLWIPGNESMFKDVAKIPPAHYMKIDGDLRISINRYWGINYKINEYSESEYVERLQHLLEESVKLHLISDVPVGAFLSGGLDSSLITALAKKNNENISSYTITLSEKDKKIEKMSDDNKYANRLAGELGLIHKDILVEPNILDMLNKIIYHLDEPIGDPAAINTFLISRLARENGIKVLLSGMGADEIFGGYRRQLATLLSQNYIKMPSVINNALSGMINPLPVKIGGTGIKSVRWLKRYLSFAGLPQDQAYMRSYSYYDKDEIQKLFNYEFDNEINEMYVDHENLFYGIKDYDMVNRMCFTDLHMFMVGLNLTYSDRASMAASVELRVPFIDRDVVEFAMSIPGKFKIRNNQSKYILKKAAAKYLPDYVVNRPKASFGMPIRAWMSGDLKGMVDDCLSAEKIKNRGILNYNFVKEIIDKDRKGIEDNAYRLYQLLTFELWCSRFLDK